jgi:murein DD-endopeptidase MepM/ murein hydrolase activator NlpD
VQGRWGELDIGPYDCAIFRLDPTFGIMRFSCIALASLLLATGCSVPRWPVDGDLSSPYGVRRSGLDFRIHRGVDIPLPVGTPVRAMAPGRVHFAGTMSGYGHTIIIDHSGRTRTLYAHLSEIHVQVGQVLAGRPVIGLSGASGNATGPHLHFEILRNGQAEDPVPLLGGFPRSR